jgi:ergothioneine biosynthesis protein EgtB
MPPVDLEARRQLLTDGYDEVRAYTEALAASLSPEDQTVQSMPDVSPTKWHRAHTSWFFETFLLEPDLKGYEVFHPAFCYLFNSYYEAVGARHPRPDRGLLSRPGVEEIARYRAHVDRAMHELLDDPAAEERLSLLELGLHHEQQHQELLLMDIKHVLSCNPLLPAYEPRDLTATANGKVGGGDIDRLGWLEHEAGTVEIGHAGGGFAFDNEGPRHEALVTPFALADRPVTCGEWLEFMADGGYHRPELWLSDGWALSRAQGWEAPLYWSIEGAPSRADLSHTTSGNSRQADSRDWRIFTLHGDRPIDPHEPVCHVSYYEADAYAHYTGARLPTETEWEAVAARVDGVGQGTGSRVFHPVGAPVARLTGDGQHRADPHFGEVWEWTQSSYAPYPGYRAPAGAVGEYNGKFMVNQYVLRGGCCATPSGHARPTYRNFFPASARWPFSGLRLARDL